VSEPRQRNDEEVVREALVWIEDNSEHFTEAREAQAALARLVGARDTAERERDEAQAVLKKASGQADMWCAAHDRQRLRAERAEAARDEARRHTSAQSNTSQRFAAYCQQAEARAERAEAALAQATEALWRIAGSIRGESEHSLDAYYDEHGLEVMHPKLVAMAALGALPPLSEPGEGT